MEMAVLSFSKEKKSLHSTCNDKMSISGMRKNRVGRKNKVKVEQFGCFNRLCSNGAYQR